MGYPAKKDDRSYTYNDYLHWPDEERWELINGTAYNMSPAPSRMHQRISTVLLGEIYNFLKGKPCEVYGAPFDVRFPEGKEEEGDIKTVVQPDIVVICDKSKLDDKGCKGSPDLIVEIVSPSTASMDYIQKLNLYERNGVREYWIVHPTDKIVMVYKLNAARQYGKPDIYSEKDNVKVGIWDDLTIPLPVVFES